MSFLLAILSLVNACTNEGTQLLCLTQGGLRVWARCLLRDVQFVTFSSIPEGEKAGESNKKADIPVHLSFLETMINLVERISSLCSRLPGELLAWIAGLFYLALLDPVSDTPVSLCVWKVVGLDFCPGCGLGRSVAFLLDGNVAGSINAHILGPFALSILVLRIALLGKDFYIMNFGKEARHA